MRELSAKMNAYQAANKSVDFDNRRTRTDVIDRGLLITGTLAEALLNRIPAAHRERYQQKIDVFNLSQKGATSKELSERFNIEAKLIGGIVATVRSAIMESIAADVFAAARKEQRL